MTRKVTARELLGDDDFEELQSEIKAIMKDPEKSTTDKYLDAEHLMNEWDVDPDYMDEFLK